MIYDDGEMPYKKKAKRKTSTKANHKHNFQPCVFEYEGVRLDKAHGFVSKEEVCIGSYCIICGKVGPCDTSKWFRYTPIKPGSSIWSYKYTEEAQQELNADTRTIPSFRLSEGYFQKYVHLTN